MPGTAKCSEHLTAAFSLLENLRQMQVLARAIGHDQDAAIFASYASTLTTAFHGRYRRHAAMDLLSVD